MTSLKGAIIETRFGSIFTTSNTLSSHVDTVLRGCLKLGWEQIRSFHAMRFGWLFYIHGNYVWEIHSLSLKSIKFVDSLINKRVGKQYTYIHIFSFLFCCDSISLTQFCHSVCLLIHRKIAGPTYRSLECVTVQTGC